MTKTIKLSYQDKEFHLPLMDGSESESAINIQNLRRETGLISYDPGLGNTGSCQSQITYIDGERGILRYRGIPLEAIAVNNHPNFIEIVWLLIFGELPSKSQYENFSKSLTDNANLDEDMKHHFSGFPRSAPPMAVLSAMISTLSCFHPEFLELEDDSQVEQAAARLISKIRTLAAYTYRKSLGLPYNYPDPSLPYVSNFLHMMFSQPFKQYLADEDIVAALNILLILHADHEQNCSTSTVRMVGSSGANLFASCAAGVNALWGPLHGGANMAVIDMLTAIDKGNLTAEEYLSLSKNKKSSVRLMGFGHRVYKSFDPRATILREVSDRLLKKIDRHDPLLKIAMELEEIALNDSYFKERNLYPNVDFYSGIILRAIGIPKNMFTVIFAIGRLPGWIAHWYEQKQQMNGKIWRPRQIYTGNQMQSYTARNQRGW